MAVQLTPASYSISKIPAAPLHPGLAPGPSRTGAEPWLEATPTTTRRVPSCLLTEGVCSET